MKKINKKEIIKNRWKLYLELFKFLQEYLGFESWNIALIGKDYNDTDTLGRIDKCEYEYYNASINFNNRKILFEDNIDIEFDRITIIFIHELSHIYTSTGSFYLEDKVNKDNMTYHSGLRFHENLINTFITREESMNNILDKVLFKGISKLKKYKEFEKIFNKLKTINEIKK